jgi:hypothetical protein
MGFPTVVFIVVSVLLVIIVILLKLNARKEALKSIERVKIGKVLVKLKELIQCNTIILEKKSNDNKSLKSAIKIHSKLYSSISSYLKSNCSDLELLESISHIDVNETPIHLMKKITVYINCRIQIKSTQDLVKIIKDNKLTDGNKKLLESAEDLFKLSKVIGIESSFLPKLTKHLNSILKLNDDLSEIIKTN